MYNREGIYLLMSNGSTYQPKISLILIGQIEKRGDIKMVCIIVKEDMIRNNHKYV